MNKDFKHPELLEGEVFLGNFTDKDHRDVGWKTKRMGNKAYNIYGDLLDTSNWANTIFPVFVLKSELDKAGVVIL